MGGDAGFDDAGAWHQHHREVSDTEAILKHGLHGLKQISF
jgi:hypothetical protein